MLFENTPTVPLTAQRRISDEVLPLCRNYVLKNDSFFFLKLLTSLVSVQLSPPPQYIDERLSLYTKLKAEHDALIAERAAKESRPIKVTLPDGKVLEAESWKTTPYQLACGISQGLADNTVIAKVNNSVWDLDRPLEDNCSLQLLKFDDEEAQAVYWHSSAHILGEAMEKVYGGCLCYGPPHRERLLLRHVSGRQRVRFPFSSVVLLGVPQGPENVVLFRCGPLIDLCRGPHVRHTGKIKALKIHKNSSTYWEGKADMETLQRIYGISFPDPKMLKEWEKFQEEAKNRDHRKLGREQDLFFFHELSPGSCFFLPKGAFIYNTLIEFIRSEYRNRGFQEVVTPNIYNSKLWVTSGHWQHYSENMFSFEVEKETFALKPMNCPGHCLVFDHRPRSWRELPLRMADFGVLHRNELSGALTGLTRVRRFQQDDAHIFCSMDQIEEEIKGCLHFLRAVYDVFGFTFKLNLSTRPEKFLGEPEMWDQAEKVIDSAALNEFGEKWVLNPGDGAFYGPKIDIQIKDAIGRYHQCATIQLDFQLPIRFNLAYVRYLVCCFSNGFMADVDLDPSCTLNKKIRNAQLSQYNFILVVGEKEKTSNTVNVRTRDNKVHGECSVEECIQRLKRLKASRSRNAEEEF
uniref:threonine--tRNA ligase n=1 Tax=Oryzias sinensis TaxID=183150 RepID=A0A8C8DP75_9TELE